MKIIKKEYRRAWGEFIAQSDWDYFVTLTSNAPTKLKKGQYQKTYNEWPADRLKCAIDRWHRALDCKLLGKKWYKKVEQRTEFVAILEHSDSNPHWHLMLKLHCDEHQKFTDVAQKIWKKHLPSGDVAISLSHDISALNAFSGYCSKCISLSDAANEVIFSKDLIN